MLTLPDSSLPNEISAAVVRVAGLVELGQLRDELKSGAVRLLSRLDLDSASCLERLIVLGETIGEIKPINSQVLLRELGHFRSDLNSATKKILPDIDLEREFARRRRPVAGQPGQPGQNPATKPGHPATSLGVKIGQSDEGNRTRVLEFVKNNPRCQFKALRFAFPDVSERTLRRVIDRLIRENQVSRIGNPGPSSFYQVTAPAEISAPASQELSTAGNLPSIIAL